MLTNEMEAAATMTPLAKRTALFLPRKLLASFGPVPLLPRVHVEPDAASQFVILTHTSVAGKVGSYRRRKKLFLFSSKTDALSLHIGFSKITLFPG